MVTEKSAPKAVYRPEVTVLDGLSDVEQAAIAREYERKTGRPFKCLPCSEAGHSAALANEAARDEPAAEVVAILQFPNRPTPVCEDCYKRITETTYIA